MTGVCGQCGRSFRLASTRGSRIAGQRCPDCGGLLQGRHAGKQRVEYLCPLLAPIDRRRDDRTAGIVTLGITGVMLTQPHRVEYVPVAGEWESSAADAKRLDGLILGTGCTVFQSAISQQPTRHRPYRLVPAPDADPLDWVVNEPLRRVKCAACGCGLVEPVPRPAEPWIPQRIEFYRGHGRRSRRCVPKMGPHPAAKPACLDCYPAAWPADIRDESRVQL